MSSPVKLKDIIEGMDFQSDESHSYLNRTTGEVVTVSDEELQAAEEGLPLEDFPEWQQERVLQAKQILGTDDFIPLPSKFEIHEWEIMDRFSRSLPDAELRETFRGAIRGSGAFRYFKDLIHRHHLAEAWYRYREEVLREIAIDWCKAHGVDYVEPFSL
jgi:hypothetical protein